MVPDQNQMRLKIFLIRPKCARRGYDPTQLRSKSPLIRPNYARIHLWSDFPDQIDLWSDHLQTMVQTFQTKMTPDQTISRPWSRLLDQNDTWSDHLQTIVQTVVRSNFRPDPLILVWEHTGVRSTGSDHKPIWVWTSTWDRNDVRHWEFCNWAMRKIAAMVL